MSESIKVLYEQRFKQLDFVASRIEDYLKTLVEEYPRIDRVAARPKSIGRFAAKAEKKNEDGSAKYSDPLNQIYDQIGARIVTFYKSDVEAVSKIVLDFFRPIEAKDLVPDSESEFGYFGKHYILFVPNEIADENFRSDVPFFELQIKTLFQHSWSEANHDLGYKPVKELSTDLKRRIAFAAAQAWGADEMFDELFSKISGREARNSEN